MIEQKQSGAVILQDGENIQETIKMSLDLDSAKNLMQILSKNLYSDSIGSTVREVSSNSLDSHRAGNVTDRPIIVTFGRSSGNYEFTVEDFGVGLSHDEVVDIISKYGKSTKRLSDTQLGLFGLGWKSPLAYTSSFTFITRKDGIERKYIMSEGEEENIIDLIDENSTDQCNGVKVIVPVNSYDASSFFKKIKEQLCYFESIYFDVNYSGNSIDNNFKITRYDDFQMSELNEDSRLHLCLDNVYYPLDFSKLGIPQISAPLGLRFGLSDGIYPTPSREAIRMTTEAKAIIIKKIKTVASKMVEMYNKSVEDTDDFNKIIQHYSNTNRYLDIGHKQNIIINDLISYSNVKVKNPKLKNISLLNLKSLVDNRGEMFSDYQIKYYLHRGRLKERKHLETVDFSSLTNKNNMFCKFSDKLGGVKKEYLKSLNHNNTYFIRRRGDRKLFPDKKQTNNYYDNRIIMSYFTLLGLGSYSKDQWRTVIKEFQLIKSSFEKNIKDADKIEIPKAWLDARKQTRVSVKTTKSGHQKLEGEISCKRAENLERYVSGKDCKFTPYSIDLKKLAQTKVFYIYTNHDDSNKLDRLYELSSRQTRTLITFSEREIKKANEIDVHNLISYENFMKGKTTVFKRLITGYLINELQRKNRSVFSYKEQLAKVSTSLSEKLVKLNEYSDTYYHSGSDVLYKEMLEVANKYDLFDYTVYGEYLEVKEVLNKFPFLETLYSKLSERYTTVSDERDGIIIDLLKYNKYKVNLEYYAKKVEKKPDTELQENEEDNN